ncbi:MAG: DUF4432 family protein [Salinibacterium sp.]|nr:DUF4432 family protein [Salinibacterium sp.]
MNAVTVWLDPDMFSRTPRELVGNGALRASAFRYSSGVEGLRIDNGVGHIVVLPFVGQQVWRAEMYGRPLTMISTFDEPIDTTDYLAGNGAYFVHCGGSAMGNPSPADGHPLHGEMPFARHSQVALEVVGGTITVRGGFTSRVSFGPYFSATTSVTVTEGSGMLESRATITNLSREPRPLMYLAHLNFRPAIGGTVVDTLRPGLSTTTRAGFDLDRPFDELLAPGVRVEPEIVQHVPAAADAKGWVTTRQLHPDGSADVVAHRSPDLTHTLRWLRRSPDDDAFGFALPATAEADGLAEETRKGNVRNYAPDESLSVQILHGVEPAQTTTPPTEWSST